MGKIVIYLNDQEQETLEKVSSLAARDPIRQAYVILINGLDEFANSYGLKEKRNEDEL